MFNPIRLHRPHVDFPGSIDGGDCNFQQQGYLPEFEILRRHRFVSKFQLQALGLRKRRSHFLLQRLLAFLDTFGETAGFAFLFAFLVPFVETYAFGMYSAFSSRLLGGDLERIGW
jgi:hypothetical protein